MQDHKIQQDAGSTPVEKSVGRTNHNPFHPDPEPTWLRNSEGVRVYAPISFTENALSYVDCRFAIHGFSGKAWQRQLEQECDRRYAQLIEIQQARKAFGPDLIFHGLMYVLASCLLAMSIGCGWRAASPAAGPAKPAAPITLTSAQVFRPHAGDHMEFVSHCVGHDAHTFIDVKTPPASNFLPADAIIFHYSKDDICAYWQPGTPEAALDFVLAPQPDTAWNSLASLISFPQSCVFCPGGFTELTADVVTPPGKPKSYLIVPSSGSNQSRVSLISPYLGYGLIGTLTYDSVVGSVAPPLTDWQTDAFVDDVSSPVYKGPALVSEQWEGPCFPTPLAGCNHERTYYAPGTADHPDPWGPVRTEVLAMGTGDHAMPILVVERTK